MIHNASELMIQTMLFLVHNNHAIQQSRIDTNTLYHIKTGASHATTRCFGNDAEFGCYSLGEPWTSEHRPISIYPQEPKEINTTYCLYTRKNTSHCQVLDPDDPSSLYGSALIPGHPTLFLVHGFIESGDKPWLMLLRDRLLDRRDVNVIVVDWGSGSGPPYSQAVANIRMVGFLTARLISRMSIDIGLRPDSVHIVGHSLGAHLAGYAGYHLREDHGMVLGRITGLDPAQPHFAHTEPLVRLDPTDAELVDVIHTDITDQVTGGFGIEEPVGHFDFYPNGGKTQPGCEQNFFSFIAQEEGFFKGIKKYIGCNHVRAHEFFSESVLEHTTPCGFWGVECDSYESFLSGNCFKCSGGSRAPICARMGFDAVTARRPKPVRPLKLFLTTGAESPFCRVMYHLAVRLSNTTRSKAEGGEVGRLRLTLYGTAGVAKDLQIHDHETFLAPGSVHKRIVSGDRVGAVQKVSLHFDYITSMNPLTWRLFEVSKIHVASVIVESLAFRRRNHDHPPRRHPDHLTFCSFNDTLTSGRPMNLTRDNLCGG